jgi:hypothetical protein
MLAFRLRKSALLCHIKRRRAARLDSCQRPAETALDGNAAVRDAQAQAVKFNLMAATVTPPARQQDDVETILRKLANLHDEGLLTDDEFAAKRAEVIAPIWSRSPHRPTPGTGRQNVVSTPTVSYRRSVIRRLVRRHGSAPFSWPSARSRNPNHLGPSGALRSAPGGGASGRPKSG